MFKFLLYKFGQFCVNHLPLKVSYRIALFLSDMQYYLSFRDRQAVRNNLKIITAGSTENLDWLTREVFRNFGRYLVEFFRMANVMNREFIEKKVNVQGVVHIQEALKRGKGVIIVTAHLGNWELGGVVLSTLGYPVVAVALPHKERPVNELFNKQRISRGMMVIPTHLAIRRCIETLKANKIVGVVADRDFTMTGEILDFLGRKALIPKGAAVFACKTGAAIVPCFLIRQGEDSFSLALEPPIYPPQSQAAHLSDETLKSVMKQYTSIIERMIRQYPDQWLMFRPFWLPQDQVEKVSDKKINQPVR